MNLSLTIDRASPVLGDFNKENVTSLDGAEMYLASPTKTFTSPAKFASLRQTISPRVRQPLEDQDPNSQDSGYGACFTSEDGKTSFRFAEPLRMAPRKTPVEPSPRKELTPSPQSKRSSSMHPSPLYSRTSSSGSESIDDGFMELFMSDKMDEETQLPTGMSDLLSGSIHKEKLPSASPMDFSPYSDSPMLPHVGQSSMSDEVPKPSFRRSLSTNDSFTPASSRVVKVRTSLFRQTNVVRTLDKSDFSGSPNLEAASPVSQLASSALSSLRLSVNGSFKRPEPPTGKHSPIQVKKRKSLQCIQDNQNTSPQNSLSPYDRPTPPKFQRCHSESEATIKSALLRASTNPDLIGDFSKPFALPLMEGRHQDLKSISADTLASLMKGEFKDEIASYTIVDCRYPYEFEGGHIRGAKNFYTKEQIMKEFVNSKDGVNKPDASDEKAASKRTILIFHCEFSSERGPNLSRFLRNSDRDTNKECYPALDYPEMYLLNGGYKQFYSKYQELCDPQAYRPMNHPDHESDLRKFRSKSKSWNGGDGKNRLYPRGVGMKRLGL
ncbi:M-phase inducer phosphatase [Frankliniella fusca]|uniref:protein-tyrosine-phosphatase n=1 Tax=Frankliniella fusca TaxID=407009 RepID=A0AAE1H3Z6_9NEOP|nr:M-phase inducer phosphatase [Frankliniella fusca]